MIQPSAIYSFPHRTSNLMRTLIVVVKGSVPQVMEAARLRAIPLIGIEKRLGTGECLCKVDGQHYDKVVAWFCEESGRAPFPAGTCLFYNQSRNSYTDDKPVNGGSHA